MKGVYYRQDGEEISVEKGRTSDGGEYWDEEVLQGSYVGVCRLSIHVRFDKVSYRLPGDQKATG